MLNNLFSKLKSVLGVSKDVKEEIISISKNDDKFVSDIETITNEVTLGFEPTQDKEQEEENIIDIQPEQPIIKKSKNRIKKAKKVKKASRNQKQGKINRAKRFFVKR